ncbi:MAG: nuclear transport factor 2 family protein [Saprospiraceae bacterium]
MGSKFNNLFSTIILVALMLSFYSCHTTQKISNSTAETDIRAVLSMQEDAWNTGNITKFMDGYWKSEQLSFIGSKGVTKGWETTLENYKRGYPNKTIMGQLTFDILSMNRISNEAYLVIGKYTLKREIDQPSGIFTLVWKLINGKWVIISDHTS